MAKQLTYAQQMEQVLEQLGNTRPRLLLHACCGPCSSAVLEKLCAHFEITVLYYNPNTWPEAEYRRRGEELARFVADAHPLGVTVVEDHYDPQEFYTAIAGLEAEPERGGRCTVCYRLRMRRAAQYAAQHGFDWFTSTLSISPHKDAARINAIGQELEAEFGVRHLPSDFKKQNGYLRSLQLSEEYGLYRQDYCGPGCKLPPPPAPGKKPPSRKKADPAAGVRFAYSSVSSGRRATSAASTSSPTQGTRLTAMPAASPA